VQTSGNTDVTTFTGSDKLERRTSNWLLTQEANAVWGETDGVESAGRYGASLRADRELGAHWSAYGLASWRRNVFSGISRQFDEGVGLAWHAVSQKPHTLDLELGAGLSQRLTTLEEQDDFGTARVGSKYTYEFSEKSKFEAGGAYVFNVNDSEDGDANARVSSPHRWRQACAQGGATTSPTGTSHRRGRKLDTTSAWAQASLT
jgi:putative salt-induced outer membrane protein YdiY